MSTIWQPVVVVGGSDVSSLVTAKLSVPAEESTARIAHFSIKTPSGTVTPGDWLGVAVTIDYKTLDSSGATLSQDRIFTGIVDRAYYDPQTQLTSFDCTDNLQADTEALSQSAIDALITASRWSEAVFGEFEDGWQYLQNLLETVPSGYDYIRSGPTGVQADWAAKATPDFSYDQSTIFDGSMQYSLAPRRDLYNEITIDYSYRFNRLKHREHSFEWNILNWGGSGWFCSIYFVDSHELPTRDIVQSAAGGSGWTAQTPMTFTKLIASASDPCGIGVAWSISDALRDTLIQAAAWTGIRRWTQEATEKYTLTIKAPQSVTWLGSVAKSITGSDQTEYNDEGWTDGVDTPTGADVRTDAHGDYVIDKLDRPTADNDIETLIAQARVEMLAAHRANWVEGRVELEPTLERSHTVKLDGVNLIGQGKVYSMTHEMDVDSGEASTLIRIAVSQNGNQAAISDDAITAPTPPNTDPAVGPSSTSTTYATHIGGRTGDPVYDETWDGFTGNYTLKDGGAETYPRRFSAPGPDVNQEAIDHVEGTATQTYNFDVPNELLTITVP